MVVRPRSDAEGSNVVNVRDSVQVVKDTYVAFLSGNIGGILENLDESVEWFAPGESEIPYAGLHRGHAGVLQFFRTLFESDEIEAVEPRSYFASGDDVVVLGHYRARVRETGDLIEDDWAQIFTVRDGRISKFREFFDTAKSGRAYRRSVAQV